MGGDIEAVVHAVDEVDVRVAGWAEEGGVVGCEAAEGVGGGVGATEVGLDFDDAADEALAFEMANEKFAEKGSGHDLGRARVEVPRKNGFGCRDAYSRSGGHFDCRSLCRMTASLCSSSLAP